MNEEMLNMLIETIIRSVRSCAEPFFAMFAEKAPTAEEPSPTPETAEPTPKPQKEAGIYRYRYLDTPSKRCKAVYVSKRSLATVLAEAYANGENETGGTFFGHMDEDGAWHIIEATGPGYGAYHTPTRHEMNNRFVNYQYRALSRIYAKPLTLVGFWHRHPGNFNRFSGLDDKVNTDYAKAIGNGTVSMLVNFTAEGPRLTCYYLDPTDCCYHRTPLIVGNKISAKKGYLTYATTAELAERAEEMQEAMEGVA